MSRPFFTLTPPKLLHDRCAGCRQRDARVEREREDTRAPSSIIAAPTTAAENAGSVAPEAWHHRGEGSPEPPSLAKTIPKTPDRAAPYQKRPCFTCQQEGHWSRDCPSKKRAGGGWGEPSVGAAVEAPECPCGAGPCAVLVSKTEKNPERKFFNCPATPYDQKCPFFQWCDSPSPYRQHDAPSPVQKQLGNMLRQGDLHPMCDCGGGWCIILTVGEGEHAGRKYFACPRRKSDEQCAFKRWFDEFNLSEKCMESRVNQNIVSPPHGNGNLRYPNCDCGAGRCRIETTKFGENAGRQYFACPVKKGQGACNFHRWLNAGDHENGKNLLVVNSGNTNQHPELAANVIGNAKAFNMKPTFLNFDDIKMGVPDAGSGKSDPLLPLEPQKGDTIGPPSRCLQFSLNNSNPNASLKPGRCYGCGKEGHWRADCVESRPSC